MRIFACTFLGSESQAFYGRVIEGVVASSRGMLRHIPAGSAHITYAFLQHPSDRLLEETVGAATIAAARHPPIAIRLGPPRVLYARTEARLVCAPVVDGAASVSQLSEDLVAELARRLPDVTISGMRSPHVTLARFRKRTHRRSATAIEEAMTLSTAGIADREDRVDVIQIVSSELTSAGPRYEIKAEVALGVRC